MRLLLPIIAIGIVILCLTLFLEGLRGRREPEDAMEASFRKLERQSDANAGRLGDWTNRFLAWVRRLGHKSAAGGRAVRRKITR
jgi:hypothetical protein